jgi:hypothetical protein
MAKAKPKGPVRVTIDTRSAAKLERALRHGLCGSPAHIIEGPPNPKDIKKSASVDLDPSTVARFAEHLKDKLIASGAHIICDDDDKKKK